jgi:predicted PurR-regulated permease PerM
LGALPGAASPLLLGCALAYIVNILMSFYERTLLQDSTNPVLGKIRRPICMVLAFVSLLAIIALVIILIVPQLVDCVELLIAQLPGAIRNGIAYLDTLPFLSDDLMNTLNEIDWQSKITEIVNVLSSGLGSVMDVVISTVSSVLSGIVTAFMSVIFSIYLLTGRDRLQAQSKRLLQHIMKPQHYEKLMYVLAVLFVLRYVFLLH